MKSSKGFGRFEVFTILVLMLGIAAYLSYTTLGGASFQKISTMKKSANMLLNTVKVNSDSFSSLDVVYLDEVIKEGFLEKIKSPFSNGNCSITESKVYLGDEPMVTLKCDNYLIEKADFISDIKVYKVGKWDTKKFNVSCEKVKLYNYLVDGKEKYDTYYEDSYFIYRMNEDLGKSYAFVDEVKKDYKVVEKVFYRTKELQ